VRARRKRGQTGFVAAGAGKGSIDIPAVLAPSAADSGLAEDEIGDDPNQWERDYDDDPCETGSRFAMWPNENPYQNRNLGQYQQSLGRGREIKEQ
jgi:hypothetical protein